MVIHTYGEKLGNKKKFLRFEIQNYHCSEIEIRLFVKKDEKYHAENRMDYRKLEFFYHFSSKNFKKMPIIRKKLHKMLKQNLHLVKKSKT